MPAIRINPDEGSLYRLSTAFGNLPNVFAVAARDSLNKSIATGRTVAATDIAAATGANKGAVSKRLHIIPATKANLAAALVIHGGVGINLIGFRARQTKAGVSARIFGQSQSFPHAFITRSITQTAFNLGAQGDKMVAIREGDKRAMTKGRYAGRKIKRGVRAGQLLLRQPIKSLKGPTAAETWEKTPGVAEHTTNTINTALPLNIERQITRFS
jgi:hypothetical protein